MGREYAAPCCARNPAPAERRVRLASHAVGPLTSGTGTTSATIRSYYPAEVTWILTPTVRQNLVASGHSGRQFLPYGARVLGPDAVAPPAGTTPNPDGTSNKAAAEEGWMVPMVELRRALADARAAGETFTLTYRQRLAPPGEAKNGAAWRRVRVEWQAGGGGSGTGVGAGRLRCTVLGRRGGACMDEERELLSTAPPAWAKKWLLYFSFPMRLRADTDTATPELGCLA